MYRHLWAVVWAMLLIHAAGCSLPTSYKVRGSDLVVTNADTKTIASARRAVVDQHGEWVEEEPGQRSGPSLAEMSRHWETSGQPSITRGTTSMDASDGEALTIEVITVAGRDSLVFFHRENGDTTDVLNTFTQALERRGVTPRR